MSETPDPGEHDAVVEVARREQKNRTRPTLSNQVMNMKFYDVVFIGYPNWWGTMPMAVFSFMEQHDFAGKKVVPFCTHEGSALGRSMHDVRELCPRSAVLAGLAIWGGNVMNAGNDVRAWLQKIGLL